MTRFLKVFRSSLVIGLRFKSNMADQLTTRTVETGKIEKPIKGLVPECVEKIGLLSGYPESQIKGRRVRVFNPAKDQTQAGTYKTRFWRVEFVDIGNRWENPCIGWASDGDPLSYMTLDFSTREDAVIYCERMGFNYTVDEPNYETPKHKSYAENFSWNRKTRISTK